MPPVSPKGSAFCTAIACSRSRAASNPSTGPKHSVVANQSSARTPSRMPGDHRSGVPATGRGVRSQCWWASVVVKAARQLLARRLDQRAHRRTGVGGRSELEGAHGVDQLGLEALRGGDVAHQDGQRRGGALLPGMPEGGAGQVGGRQIEVGLGHDDQRVLSRRLGHERCRGGQACEELARSRRTR